MTQRYIIASNDSGDHFYIPIEKQDEWDAWLFSELWEMGETPDYARHIDGTFTFTDPKVE